MKFSIISKAFLSIDIFVNVSSEKLVLQTTSKQSHILLYKKKIYSSPMLFLFQNIRPYFFSWFAKVTYEKSSTRGNQTRKILQKIFTMIIYSFFEEKKMQTKFIFIRLLWKYSKKYCKSNSWRVWIRKRPMADTRFIFCCQK